jgi:hypothetical protein
LTSAIALVLWRRSQQGAAERLAGYLGRAGS